MFKSIKNMQGGVTLNLSKSNEPLRAPQHIPSPKQWLIPLLTDCDAPLKLGDTVTVGQCIQIDPLQRHRCVISPVNACIEAYIALEGQPYIVLSPNHAIKSDATTAWHTVTIEQALNWAPESIVERITQAGIVGMGGAGFPAALKLTQPLKHIVLNACECEPLVRSDEGLLIEQAADVLNGILLLAKATQCPSIVIAIKNNNAQAIQALQIASEAIQTDVSIRIEMLTDYYPIGGEKQIIEYIWGKQISGMHYPQEIGIVSFNVATCYAVFQAVVTGIPPQKRLISLIDIEQQKSELIWAHIGQSIASLLQVLSYKAKGDTIAGGLMMGKSLLNLQYPILPTTTSIIINYHDDSRKEEACIRCGECEVACPMHLIPQQLFYFSKAKNEQQMLAYRLFDCIECGCCDYVCPSKIPLTQVYKTSKAELREAQQERKLAAVARQRFEERESRLEHIKNEREKRIAAKRTQLKQAISEQQKSSNPQDVRQRAIEAAKKRKASSMNKKNES